MKRVLLVVALLGWSGLAFATEHVAPNAVTNLAVSTTVGKTTLLVTWTAPGDQCGNATCAEYELRYSTSTLDECNFEYGTLVSFVDAPQSPGSSECGSAMNLNCNTTYYFALRVKDAAGNWSVLSNVASGRTASCSTSREVACP